MWFLHNTTNKIKCKNMKLIHMQMHKIVTMLPRSVFLQNHHALEMQSELFRWICTTSVARQTHSDQDKLKAKTQSYSYYVCTVHW